MISFTLLGLVGASLGCYKFGYLNKLKAYEELSAAQQFDCIADAAGTISRSSGSKVYACIKGTVEAAKPIACEFAKGADGSPLMVVVYNKKLFRVYEEWVGRHWVTMSQLLTNKTLETPFNIVDKTGKVAVQAGVDQMPLQVIFDKFEPAVSSQSFAQSVADLLLASTRETGVRTEELGLPVGSYVYTFGEASYDPSIHSLVLRPPADSRQFFISRVSLAEFKKTQLKSADLWWWASTILFTLAVSYAAYKGYKWWKKRQEERDFVLPPDSRVCSVCLNREVAVAFTPCNHVCTCRECSPQLTTCPICRSPIQSRHNLVFS